MKTKAFTGYGKSSKNCIFFLLVSLLISFTYQTCILFNLFNACKNKCLTITKANACYKIKLFLIYFI